MPNSSGRYTRPDAAQEYFSFEKVNKSGTDYGATDQVTLNASDWGTIANPSYTDVNTAQTIVCSGLPHQFNSRVGVVIEDTVDGEVGAVTWEGTFLMPIATGITPTPGEPAYWDVSAEEFILAAPATGDIQVGYFAGTELTIAAADQYHLPAGDYCLVQFSAMQIVQP